MLHQIRAALTERRIAQYQAAQQIGMSDTRLSRIICERLEATDEEKRSLSRLLGLPVEDLFAGAKSGGRELVRLERAVAPRGSKGAK
jgi:transcriptional regulator with XRE-family HTH domain